MFNKIGLQELCQEIYLLSHNRNDDNKKYELTYEKYINLYPELKYYSIIIGSNDTTNNYFHKTIIQLINKKPFNGLNNKLIHVHHDFPNFSNIVYLSDKKGKNPTLDSTIFIDSNAMNLFNEFYKTPKEYSIDFINLKIEYNIDLNYLPYILEDYVNCRHKNFKIEKTYEKIKSFEIINNIDKEYYDKFKEIRIDNDKLNYAGFKTICELIDNKIFYFSNFFEKKDAKKLKLSNSSWFTYLAPNKDINIHEFFSEYDLYYGLILNLIIQKHTKTSIEKKMYSLIHNMFITGQQLIQFLEFAHNYFEDEQINDINKFLIFDFRWNYEKMIDKVHNITWDIFIYMISKGFMTNALRKDRNNEIKADFGVPLFLTEDSRFFMAYVKNYTNKIILVDEKIKERPFNGIPIQTELTHKINIYINKFITNNLDIKIIKEKISKITKKKYTNKRNTAIHSIRRLFREKMEQEFEKFVTKK